MSIRSNRTGPEDIEDLSNRKLEEKLVILEVARQTKYKRFVNGGEKYEDESDREKVPGSSCSGGTTTYSAVQRKALGYFCVFIMLTSVVVGDSTAQVLHGVAPAMQLNLHRFIVQLICILPIICYTRKALIVPLKTGLWLTLSSVFGCLVLFLVFEGLRYIPIGTFGAFFSTILMWASALLARCFLREGMNAVKVAALMASSVGIVFVLQPERLFTTAGLPGNSSTENSTLVTDLSMLSAAGSWNDPTTTISVVAPMAATASYILGCLLSSLGASANAVCLVLQPYKLHEVRAHVQIVWNVVIGFLLALILTFATSSPVYYFGEDLAMVIGNAIAAALLWPALIFSLTLISPTIVACLLPVQLVLMYILQKTLLRGIFPGSGNLPLEVIGIILVVAAALLTPLFKTLKGVNTDNV